MNKRQFLYSSHTFIFILILTAIVIVVNILAYSYHFRTDLTEYDENSLSLQTIKILENITDPIRVYAFYRDDDPGVKSIRRLLAIYQYYCSKFDFDLVDPDQNPSQAEKFNISGYRTLVIETNDQHDWLTEPTEEKITNAILRLQRTTKKVVCFSIGHGERNVESNEKNGYASLIPHIKADNYEVTAISLEHSPVPDDCAVLIIPGSKRSFSEAEIEAITAFRQQGGALLLMLDPQPQGVLTPELLTSWSIRARDDRVIDPASRMMGTDFYVPLIDTYNGQHPITDDFRQMTLFPLLRSFQVTSSGDSLLAIQVLAQSNTSSWSESHPDSMQFTPGVDVEGPLDIAVAAVEPQTGARLVVLGDSDFVTNLYLYQQGNLDFFMNCLNWVSQEDNLISIESRYIQPRLLHLSQRQARFLFWISVVLVPMMILLTGVLVWWLKQ